MGTYNHNNDRLEERAAEIAVTLADLGLVRGDERGNPIDNRIHERVDHLVGALALARRDWTTPLCRGWLHDQWPELVDWCRDDPFGLLGRLNRAPGREVDPMA